MVLLLLYTYTLFEPPGNGFHSWKNLLNNPMNPKNSWKLKLFLPSYFFIDRKLLYHFNFFFLLIFRTLLTLLVTKF